MNHHFRRFVITAVTLIPVTCASADWPRWRGEDDSGSVVAGNYPSELSAARTTWKAKLPGKGCSTPILVHGKIFVTAPVDGKDALLALDSEGNQLWETTFELEVGGKHKNGSGCNASPVTDGESVFVYFKSGTLAAVDFDGAIRWQTDLTERFGAAQLFWDHGTSPVLTKGHVVFARIHAGDSWVAAFDKVSGQLTWKVARNYETPVECDHGYATPIVMQWKGRECILVWGAEHLTLHDAADGNVVWSCGDFNPDENKLWPSIATPVLFDDLAVVAYGRNDRRIPRLHGVRLGADSKQEHQWFRDDIGTFVPTPVAYRGKLYLVRDHGQVECLDPVTGKTVWSEAFPKNRNKFYASPLIAGGKLYAPREDGVVFVASVSDSVFELLSENDMGEPVIGSPIPTRDGILIRGEKHLYCIQ
ncbi:MAG: PQQ-binding-like beta-propeller repeat protein [Planctomycetota bacterium]